MMQPRAYQAAAVAAVYSHLKDRSDQPCIVIPTGGGKSLCIAMICRDTVLQWQGRVLILAHRKELLKQNSDTLLRLAPELKGKVGIYSAGLNSRETSQPVIVAGIQSVFRRSCDIGRFDLAIIDEAHLIPETGYGMYRTLIADLQIINPDIRFIGLTATPYRMTTGAICTPDGIINHVCHDVGIKELIEEGYLCPLISKAGKDKTDFSGVHIREGEFMPGELEALMDTDAKVNAACTEIIECTWNRKSCLIFASGINHGKHIADVLREKGAKAETIFGDTPSEERTATIEAFKAGQIKYLVSVGVLTTGFDAPNIDCVALLRATMSPGLFVQMVGRGSRIVVDVNSIQTSEGRRQAIAESKKPNCMVLDFGNNILRHGPVDTVNMMVSRQAGEKPGEAPAKECPECQGLIAAGFRACPYCGFVFPVPKLKHDIKASSAGILTGQITTDNRPVVSVSYHVHYKRGATEDSPPTMRVKYELENDSISEWICIEHTGWARSKAESWWIARSNIPTPLTVQEAVDLANDGVLIMPKTITLKRITGEKYDKITGYELEAKPSSYSRQPGDEIGAPDMALSVWDGNLDDLPF